MHYVCCIKQVPDTAEVKIDPSTNTLVRTGVESISNPFDIVALEAAIQLKERYGGRVTAVSMGPPQAAQSLRDALSLGADEAILLSDRSFAGADTLATSYTLATAIKKIRNQTPVDLIFCGKQAIDGDTAQVGPGLATRLGYTLFAYVTEIQWIDPITRQIQVKRKVEGGFEIICGAFPALLTAELELAKPRRASLPSMIRSLRAGIQVWDARDIEADMNKAGLRGSPTWVKNVFAPPYRGGGLKFDARHDPFEAVEKCLDVLIADEAFAPELLKRWEA